MNIYRTILIISFFSISLQAQMYIDGDTLYGNEWINYDQSFYKIAVSKDGFYKMNFQELSDAGIFSGGNPQGGDFQLFYHGEEVPIHVSQTGSFGNNDFIIFYGERNKTRLDEHLYIEPSFIPNPDYSIFTDTSAYFLTWKRSILL